MPKLKRRSGDKPSNIEPRTAATEIDTSETRPPVFSFEHLQNGWCIQDCESIERAKMLDRLRVLGKMPWKHLRQEPRHRYGTETIAQQSLRVGIPSFITQDVRLLAFRAFDLAPMVGYKQGRVFHVIWIDRAFKLYEH